MTQNDVACVDHFVVSTYLNWTATVIVSLFFADDDAAGDVDVWV